MRFPSKSKQMFEQMFNISLQFHAKILLVLCFCLCAQPPKVSRLTFTGNCQLMTDNFLFLCVSSASLRFKVFAFAAALSRVPAVQLRNVHSGSNSCLVAIFAPI